MLVVSSLRYLTNYRDIIEISERIKRPERKKDAKDRSPDDQVSRKQGSYSKALSGESFGKVSNPTKTMDLKFVECFKCYKKGIYANKY